MCETVIILFYNHVLLVVLGFSGFFTTHFSQPHKQIDSQITDHN